MLPIERTIEDLRLNRIKEMLKAMTFRAESCHKKNGALWKLFARKRGFALLLHVQLQSMSRLGLLQHFAMSGIHQ